MALLCLATAARAAVKMVAVGPGATLTFADAESGSNTTTVMVGDTVMWVWQSSGHSTTRSGSGEAWDSGVRATPFTFTHVFTVPGTYAYHCTPHQAFGMTGTVVVQGAGGPTTTTTLPSFACSDPRAAAATRAQIAGECECPSATTHAAYVSCAAKLVKAAVKAGTLPAGCRHAIRSCVAKSTCGRPGFVTCCRTSGAGQTKCSIKRRAGACKMPRGGTACVGSETSCCDACTATGCAP